MASYILIFSEIGASEEHAVFRIAVECLPEALKLSNGCYLFTSDEKPQAIYQDLVDKLPKHDRLHILSVGRPGYGHGDESINKWLKNNL